MSTIPKSGQWVIVLIVLISLLLLYTGYDKQTQTLNFDKVLQVLSLQDWSFSLKELNKITALGGLGLISIAFILGPLSRLWPKLFTQFLLWRKFLGLFGFGLVVLHAVYSLVFIYGLSLDSLIFMNSKLSGFLAGLLAFIIFTLMALTSTKKAEETLGYSQWKKLQTTGYLALFLSILHFIIMEIKPDKGFDVRPFGQLFLVLAIVALIVRMGLIFIQTQPRTKFEDHVASPAEPKK